MKRITLLSLRACVFLVAVATVSVTSADITGTFVAAVDGGNSYASSDGTSVFSNTTATAGFWHNRVGVFDIIGLPSPASGAYQGQNKTGGAQTHREVVTTLTGLTPGTSYDIFIIYGASISPSGGFQHIDAGFTSGALTTLLEAGGVDTGLGLMAGAGVDWRAYQQKIGTTTANAGGQIKAYVGATLDAERSIYNGLSYQVSAIPEPTSLLLMMGASLGFCCFRRRN